MKTKLLLMPLLAMTCLLTTGCGGQESALVVPDANTLEQDNMMQQEQEKQVAEYLDSLKSQ